jgi:dUTP pyrophosphatase
MKMDSIRVAKVGPVKSKSVPNRATEGSAGYDLRAVENAIIKARRQEAIPTGISFEIPVGFVGQIWPRSGMAAKNSIDVLAGVIDSDYRGEIKVILFNHSNVNYRINAGDRIAQMLIVPFLEAEIELVERIELVESLFDSDRGDGGFGSSGK